MEFSFNPFGDGKKKTTRTMNYLRKEGGVLETANQVKDALVIANQVLDSGDQLSVASVEQLLKFATPKDGLTSSSYFDNARFAEEAQVSKEMGLEKEGINDEAGIWGHRFFIEPTDEATALVLVKKGFLEARLQNLRGLAQIYRENSDKVNGAYTFDARLEPQNLMAWRDIVAQSKAGGTDAYKEWDNTFDRNEGIKARDIGKRGQDDLFEVSVVSEGSESLNRGFKEMIEEKKVAKAVLFKNSEGKVTSVEIWYPHFTADESEGRKILQAISSKFEIDTDVVDNNVNVLRAYQTTDSTGEAVNILDMENNFRLTKEEKELSDKVLRVLDINRSAFFAYSWMSVEDEKSAYICVNPELPDSGASGLQLALLPAPAEIKKLKAPLAEARWDIPPRVVNLINMDPFEKEVGKPVIDSMRSIANFSRTEIRKAKRALSTLSILGVYLGSIARKVFKSALNKQHKLFAEGSFQVSSVNYKKENLKNITFITATNMTAKRVLSINSDDKGVACNLRIVSDRQMQEQIFERYGKMGVNKINYEDYKAEAKNIVMEKQIKFRRALVFMSLMVLQNAINTSPGALKDRKLQEVYNLASAALININNEIDARATR